MNDYISVGLAGLNKDLIKAFWLAGGKHKLQNNGPSYVYIYMYLPMCIWKWLEEYKAGYEGEEGTGLSLNETYKTVTHFL